MRLGNIEPGWETLIPAGTDGIAVEVQTIPVDRSIRRRARRAAAAVLDGQDIDNLDAMDLADIGDAYSREILRLTIVAWRGVLDASGQTAELTPSHKVRMQTSAKDDRPLGTIDAFLADEDAFEAADRLIVSPIVERDREKNASSASPNGTGKAATRGRNIAGSPVGRNKTAAAKSARTARTSPKAPKAKTCGKSSTTAPASSASAG